MLYLQFSLYLGKGLNVVSLLEEGLNVVYLLEERTQCRIFNLRWRKVSMSYLHNLQHGCVVLVILSGDLSKINDPFVLVQGLGLYLHLFYCLLFSNRTKLVFLSLLIFYSLIIWTSSDYLPKFKYGGAAVNTQFRPGK